MNHNNDIERDLRTLEKEVRDLWRVVFGLVGAIMGTILFHAFGH